MSKETLITGKKSLRQTMAQTGKVLFGKEVPNYTLQFIDPTKTKRAGEHTTIVNPYIELGRASNNVIQYGEEYSTVSRKHASISFDNGQVVINSLGKNPTYVNGQEVYGKKVLNNGDEIQLSSNGPRIRFNSTPTLTSNMKFTQRMGLMAEQALKPYKQLVTVLFILLFVAIGSGAWYGIKTNKELSNVSTQLEGTEQLVKQQQQIIAQNEANLRKMEMKGEKQTYEYKKLKNATATLIQNLKTTQSELNKMKKSSFQPHEIKNGNDDPIPSNNLSNITFDDLPTDDVYFIGAYKIEISFPEKKLQIIDAKYMKENVNPNFSGYFLYTGTAFLTTEHELISARHIVQPYRYTQNLDTYQLIAIQEARGAKITVFFEAIRKDGNLAFTFTDRGIQYDDSSDKNVTLNYNGEDYPYKVATNGASDWAYIKLRTFNGSIKYNRELSTSLKIGDELYAVGFGYGGALQPQKGDLKPLVGRGFVAQNGLTNGVINLSNQALTHGYSGGPVFKYVNGDFICVGIISAGIGANVGIIVPVANLR